MCGFTGRVALRGHKVSPLKDSDLIFQRLRGPDETRRVDASAYSLAFSLLSLTDSRKAMQPFQLTDKRTLLFNGEIYNYKEIDSLLAYPEASANRSDTYTLSKLFELERYDLLPQLRGMFAIALLDLKAAKLRFYSDFFGQKSLYYVISGEEVIFSTDLKSLAIASSAGLSFDWQAFLKEEWLWSRPTRDVESPLPSFFKGVGRVQPGECLCIDLENAKTHSSRLIYSSQANIVDALRNHLSKTIDSTHSSFCFVSGGLDSWIVASQLMAKKRSYQAFTFDHISTRMNGELERALSFSSQMGIPVNTLSLNSINSLETWKEALLVSENPFFSPDQFFKYSMLKQLKDQGSSARLLYTGQGADELFGGYLPDYGDSLEEALHNIRYVYRNEDLSDEDAYGLYLRSKRRDMALFAINLDDRISGHFSLENRAPLLSEDVFLAAQESAKSHDLDLFFNKQVLRDSFAKELSADVCKVKKTHFFYGRGLDFVQNEAFEWALRHINELESQGSLSADARNIFKEYFNTDNASLNFVHLKSSKIPWTTKLRLLNAALLEAVFQSPQDLIKGVFS